jgi:hypothetical protein
METVLSQPIQAPPVSKAALWTGRVISTLMILFMLMDAVMKFVKPDPVLKGTMKLGYPESCIVEIGGILLAFTILYIIPRTAVLGAICLTGYLGGAFASQLRIGSPMFDMLFPVLFGVLIWLGLVLRNPRLRSLIPFVES